jgi:hypothetical protein
VVFVAWIHDAAEPVQPTKVDGWHAGAFCGRPGATGSGVC